MTPALKPIPASWPRLRVAVRVIRPWMTTITAFAAVIYGSYLFIVHLADPLYYAVSRGIRQDCYEATKLSSECRDYADNSAGLPVGLGLITAIFLLLTITAWLGHAHKMLRDGWDDEYVEGVKVLLVFTACLLVLLLLAVVGIYGLHLYWPELPETTPAPVPRTWLPPDRRA